MQHEKGGKLEILNMSEYRPFVFWRVITVDVSYNIKLKTTVIVFGRRFKAELSLLVFIYIFGYRWYIIYRIVHIYTNILYFSI